MASRSVTSPSGSARQNQRPMRRRGGLPSMSEKQTQAYLIARDALRRIRRTSALVLPSPDAVPRGLVCHRLRGDESDTKKPA